MGDDEWEKLPTEDKVVHKLWKARVAGYEEAKKKFQMISNEKTKEFTSYLGILKKFVTDNNAVAQEKGLLATLAFVENCSDSTRVCSDVVSGVVTKVLNSKPKLKQLGMDICLMYIELEKQEVVMEELINGFSNKQPKVVAACVSLTNQALREFGGKVITMKPIVKSLQKLLEHQDKTVREEAKSLAVELYKWIRDALRPQLSSIKPVQLKELEDEWAQVDANKPSPTRFTKTEQAKRAAAPPPQEKTAPASDEVDASEEVSDEPDENIDPYDLMDAVDIIPLIPKDFFEQIVQTKWSERKEALEGLDKLTSKPKIEAGQFGDVMGCLKKVVAKDSNVVVVALAAKCVQGLAKGLRKKFNPYAPMIIPVILEKFKEKKMNVVIALRDAIDAVFLTTTFSNMVEDVIASLESKNPNVKEETCKFLTRAISQLTQATLPKPILKQITPVLIKKMDDTVAGVRDNAAEALGTSMKVVGEKVMLPYIDQLDKIKAEKVKECYEKAEVVTSGKSTKAVKPAAAASKTANNPAAASKAPAAASSSTNTAAKKPVKKKLAGAGAKAKKPQSAPQGKKDGGKKAKKGAAAYADDEAEPTEQELSEGVVEDIALELFGETICKQIVSANWKERLEAMEEMTKKVNVMTPDAKQTQTIVRTLAKKPGFKDNNMMVLKGKFSLLGILAKVSKPFSRRSALYAITGLIEKIGDMKLKDAVKETLKIFAENISLNYVSLKVAKVSSQVKNPKTQAEALVWMSEGLREFGFKIDMKPHIAFIKTSLQNTNPAIRGAAVQFLATLYLYAGPSLRTVFEDEKPALLQQIDAEFDKVKDEKPPAPVRKVLGDQDDEDEEEEGADGEQDEDAVDGEAGGMNADDLVDRKNISDKITEALISKLTDKNWKIRNEGLQEVVELLKENKFIMPDIGELPIALKARLGESNKNLVMISLGICKTLAEGIGSQVSRHKGTLLLAMISTMNDAKPQVTVTAKEALSAWHSKIGFAPFLTDEILSSAMKIPKPNLRIGLLSWMEEILKLETKKLPADLLESIPALFGCLEDRNAEVRKNAQAVLPLVMAHTGFEPMAKAANKLEASSKATVMTLLEKARETCVPIQTAKKTKTAKQSKPASSGASTSDAPAREVKKVAEESKKTKSAENKKPAAKKPASASTSKKKNQEEDDGPAILHKIGKDQRMKDEKSLKTLKWNFTTPREEMVQQLKDQMTPCFSGSMMKRLFHDDFKFHIEAIALFSQGLSSNTPAMIESLDIILRWFTLRFFDTNTSVLLKSLEFLESLFDILAEENHNLSEFEGSSFVPYLILKIGDPKDNVRKSVHNLFKKLADIYPATKLFTFLMEGLVSKNSKTRMECLVELGTLISKSGIEVCQPTPAKALKEMAVQIADRDNGVRSAALNAIVEAYNIVGEQVYKMIGRLNDKDRSYLEERIKRAGKVKAAQPPEPKKPPTEANKSKIAPNKPASDAKDQTDSQVLVVSKIKGRGSSSSNDGPVRPNTSPQVKREFELDYEQIKGGKDIIKGVKPKLIEVDVDDDDFTIAKPLVNVAGKTAMTSAARDIPAWLDLTIAQIASSEVNVSLEALAQFEEVFKRHNEEPEVIKKIDQYLLTCLVQFRMFFSRHLEMKENSQEEIIRLMKYLLNGFMLTFSTTSLAAAVSKNVLKDSIMFFVNIMLDSKLSQLEECAVVVKTINIILLKVIHNGDQTSSFWAVIKLMMDGIEHEIPQKVQDLYLKCLWKLARYLPERIQDFRTDAALLDMHLFLKKYPSSYWRTKSDRRPMETIRLFLRTLMKLLGPDILNKTILIEDPDASELVPFLKKSMQKTTDTKAAVNTESVKETKVEQSISNGGGEKSTVDMLQEIFKKIGSKENSQEGLKELYEFKEKYPEEDVEPYYAKTSQFFRNYIERGLKSIETKRKSPDQTADGSRTLISIGNNGGMQGNGVTSVGGADKYLDRLKLLREKYLQMNNESQSEQQKDSVDNKPSLPLVDITTSNQQEQPMPDITQVAEKKEKKEVNLDDLRRRLQQIKKGSSS
ncbi:cytoskeleton-associated protein 5-like isoform X2 [Rhopilema esculentum]|uniref:cytoskeleton-associated protein 5-like isoform X2 n=1 Tax=Rhopilema esculentum TaxID=499914 RepID=UPI0031DC9AED